MTLPVAIGFWVFGGGLLGLIALTLVVLALADLLGKRKDIQGSQRAAWILLIVLLPLIGSIIYFARRPMQEDEKEKMMESAVRRHGR
jgi:hypothetical protein